MLGVLGCGRSKKEKAVKKSILHLLQHTHRGMSCPRSPVLIGADVGYLKWKSDVYNEGVNQRRVGSECEIRQLNEG